MNRARVVAAIVCASARWTGASLALAHGGDAVALEARLHARGLDVITYVGQRPMQRELRNPPNMPLAALSRAQLLPRVTERVIMRTQVSTAREACQRGPLLRVEPDPDGQALRLLHRYSCQGALQPGLRVQFDPLPEQRARTFVYGAFYAGGRSHVHTFVGREAKLDAAAFSQPVAVDETRHFDALFPPLPPAASATGRRPWLIAVLATLLGGAALIWRLRGLHRRAASERSYAP